MLTTVIASAFYVLLISSNGNPSKYMGVSVKVGKSVCSTFDESLSRVSTSRQPSVWESSTKECAWILNRNTWKAELGKPFIWRFACNQKGNSPGKRTRTGDDLCSDPCEGVPEDPEGGQHFVHLPESCEKGETYESSYCSNYFRCVEDIDGSTDWQEVTCGIGSYWNPLNSTFGRCSTFKQLPVDRQSRYCTKGCVRRCPATKALPGIKTAVVGQYPQPWIDGPRACDTDDRCVPGHKRNVSAACRNWDTCDSNGEWEEHVCPNKPRGRIFYYQKTQCDGECVDFDQLPQSLQDYYIAHPCCNISPPSTGTATLTTPTTTKTTGTGTTTTSTKTSTPTTTTGTGTITISTKTSTPTTTTGTGTTTTSTKTSTPTTTTGTGTNTISTKTSTPTTTTGTGTNTISTKTSTPTTTTGTGTNTISTKTSTPTTTTGTGTNTISTKTSTPTTTTGTGTNTISTKTSTTTSTGTPPTTTHTTSCQCILMGYCKDYKECIICPNGTKTCVDRGHCGGQLYWLTNDITGGMCVHWENLPADLQAKYRADPLCYGCEWFQKLKDVCSPRYTFRDQNFKEHDMICPPPPKGQNQLYWQIRAKTCDGCQYAVDYYGKPCKCPS